MDRLKNRVTSLPVLVGHPLAPIGRGEDIRSSCRCLQKAGCAAAVYDVSPSPRSYGDPDLEREIKNHLVRSLSSNINVFYLNGDEIKRWMDQLAGHLPSGAYNIICPQWELGIYPDEWSEQLNRFDEVWAPSLFVFECLRRSTSKPVFHFPLSVQVELASFLGRRYFRLPESAYLFLFCFDFRSFIDRKNPLAVVKAFERVCDVRSKDNIYLVVKLHGAESGAKGKFAAEQFFVEINQSRVRDRIIVLDDVFTDNEIKNLIRCCDCFVSLHRSEGFGRGIAEAMFLGKPVVATGYSGNLDFMNDGNSCLVRYKMVEVGKDCYPYWENQVWAEPDIDHAVSQMLKLVDDRDYGRALGRTASRFIRTHFSARAIGLKYQKRIDQILLWNGRLELTTDTSRTQNKAESSIKKVGSNVAPATDR
jgi:glycosyltransferase involved in cell wall biosynthesis